jgi:Asp-tRNA(Asn)/Glu-tRNA(Gln) amidotransferase A subunit family amidase
MHQDGCMGDELWSKSVGELAALIRTREVSSVEVVQAHLDRISDVN